MMFGVREICDVVLRAKSRMELGSRVFYKNEPVIYFDTLKTSTLEGAATTVYATGGRGNARLIAWEGERTVTFTFEDALISPAGFAILSGADLIDASTDTPIYVHTTAQAEVTTAGKIELKDEKICWNKEISEGTTANYDYHANADVCIILLNRGDKEQDAEPCVPKEVNGKTITCDALKQGDVVLVDYYVKKTGGAQQIEITADKFAGNFYLEASTLFRRESDGVDMPAEFVIPNGKIQSNFSFAMASSGDPSTFTFTMDAFPDYTKFDPTKKVIAAIQIINETVEAETDNRGTRGCFNGATGE